jgi:hypothetical protein
LHVANKFAPRGPAASTQSRTPRFETEIATSGSIRRSYGHPSPKRRLKPVSWRRLAELDRPRPRRARCRMHPGTKPNRRKAPTTRCWRRHLQASHRLLRPSRSAPSARLPQSSRRGPVPITAAKGELLVPDRSTSWDGWMRAGSKSERQSQALSVFLVRAKEGSYREQRRRIVGAANRPS